MQQPPPGAAPADQSWGGSADAVKSVFSAGAGAVCMALPGFVKNFWSANDPGDTTPSMNELNGNSQPNDTAEPAGDDRKTLRVRCSCDDRSCLASTGKRLNNGAKAVAAGAVAGGATGAAAVAAAVPVIQAAGFTANGIAAGSMAAGMMSSAATAAGGSVASGSTVAVCQSIGALGVLPGAIAAPVVLGAVAVGMVVPALIYTLRSEANEQPVADSGSGQIEGHWVLATEDNGEAYVVQFDSEEEARNAFGDAVAPRILFSPDHREVQVGGVDSGQEVIRRVMSKHYFEREVSLDHDSRRHDAIQQAAQRSKEMGDHAFAVGNFEEALLSYTDAITLHSATPMTPSRLHVYHSSRAATFLKLGIALNALDDADLVIGLQPDWSDGYLLKGEALTYLGRFVEALRTYTSGLAVCGATDVFQHRLNVLASEMASRQVD